MDKDTAEAIVMEVMEIECERCGETKGIAFEPSHTAYADEKIGAGYWFCKDCLKEYRDYWDERWKEHYNSLL